MSITPEVHLVTQLEQDALAPSTVPEELRLHIVHAIADVGASAVLLDRHNHKLGELSRKEAVAGGRAFFVRVRGDVLAADFDTSDGVSKAHRLYCTLRVAGYLPVLVASGRPGHRHVLCRVPPHEHERVLRTAATCNGEVRRPIRPPLTPHRREGECGVSSGLLLPGEAGEALRRLDGTRIGRTLGGHGHNLISRSAVSPGLTASEVVLAMGMSAANAGWTVEELLMLLTCAHFPIAQIYADRCSRRGVEATDRWVRLHVWPSAVTTIQAAPPRHQRTTPHALALLNHAVRSTWPGRTGPTDRAVYLGLVRKHLLSGANPVDASVRELCELAGISGQTTVVAALKRLEHRGWVARQRDQGAHQNAPRRLSTAWRLHDPDDLDAAATGPDFLIVLEHAGADVFRNGFGIGKAGQQVFDTVVCWPRETTAQVAARAGRSPTRVRQLLQVMQDVRLVSCDDDGTWSAHVERLEEAARELGEAAGRGERQRLRFALDRRAFDQGRWT